MGCVTLRSSIPVLRVSDFARSRRFWVEVMEFTVAEEAGSPAQFGIFRRDHARVFVNGLDGPDPEPSPGWRAYFHSDDIDGLAARLKSLGAQVDGPENRSYGMRELTLRDPDGNLLCFGQDITQADENMT